MFDPAMTPPGPRASSRRARSRMAVCGRARASSAPSKFLGRRSSYVYSVVAADDDRFVDIRVDKPFPMQVRYELEDCRPTEPCADSRRVATPDDFFNLRRRSSAIMVGRSIGADLERPASAS